MTRILALQELMVEHAGPELFPCFSIYASTITVTH